MGDDSLEGTVPLFPSRDWMEEFAARLAGHPDAGATATALDGIYRFVIDPGGLLRERHAYDVEIRPEGDGAVVQPLDTPVETPRLTITAGYDRWRQLIRRELDIPMAVLLRRIKVSGDLATLTGRMSSTTALLDALAGVDSTFLGDGAG